MINSAFYIVLFEFEDPHLIIDLVSELLVLGIFEQLSERLAGSIDIAVPGYFCYLRHVQPRIEIDLIFGICIQTFFVIIVSFGFETQALVHLANDEVDPPFPVFFCQQAVDRGEAANHLIIIFQQLMIIRFLEKEFLLVRFTQARFFKVIDGGLCVVHLPVLDVSADEIDDREMFCVLVL